MERIGVLTGGGDCPGLNAAIRAVVRKARALGYDVIGLRRGWRGLMEKDIVSLNLDSVSGILPKGGTILGTSRTNPYKSAEDAAVAQKNFKELQLKALVAIGGEDTLGVAAKLSRDGFPVIGVPKTIDGDIWGTEATIGFDTAVNIATDAIDRLHSTAESHDRVMIVEIMGRHAGWLALRSGLAGGADLILIPEVPTNIQSITETIIKRHKRGKNFSIVVVSEGAKVDFGEAESTEVLKNAELDEFGHVSLGGVANVLASKLKAITHFDTRVTTLGHVQRGGTPTAFDRALASHLGVLAVSLIHQGKSGRMVALKDGRFTDVDLEGVLGKLRLVDEGEYRVAEVFLDKDLNEAIARSDLESLCSREWLCTNGLGGFASGTVSLAHTRKYHGLLVTTIRGRSGRYNLLNQMETWIVLDGEEFPLSTNLYGDVCYPHGYKHIRGFKSRPHPTWQFLIRDMLWSMSLAMVPGQPTILIRYHFVQGPQGAHLRCRPLLAFRNMHQVEEIRDHACFDVTPHDQAWELRPFPEDPSLFLSSSMPGVFQAEPHWHQNHTYPEEYRRGYPYRETLLHPGVLAFQLEPGQDCVISASTKPFMSPGPLWQNLPSGHSDTLVQSARSFVITNPAGQRSVLAGYPWFDEWGRDTLIALPGLTLHEQQGNCAAEILQTYANQRIDGLIPNTLGFGGGSHGTNSLDASLWFGWSLWHCQRQWPDHHHLGALGDVLCELRTSLQNRHSGLIQVHVNGLIWSGTSMTNLTWMDAQVDGVPITPRWGYAVEINALWLHLLYLTDAPEFERTLDSFRRLFWNGTYLCDTVTDNGQDSSIRPNQLVALACAPEIVSSDMACSMLRIIHDELVTPYGLRTLSPDDPNYRGQYAGSQAERDSAYHQGTVWPWLCGIYADGALRYATNPETTAMQLLKTFEPLWSAHLADAGIGHISEVFDGDPPHRPGGCFAQAWSTAEVIRAKMMLERGI